MVLLDPRNVPPFMFTLKTLITYLLSCYSCFVLLWLALAYLSLPDYRCVDLSTLSRGKGEPTTTPPTSKYARTNHLWWGKIPMESVTKYILIRDVGLDATGKLHHQSSGSWWGEWFQAHRCISETKQKNPFKKKRKIIEKYNSWSELLMPLTEG